MSTREIHAEQLLGRRVRDVNGTILGRIEEMRMDVVDGETVITEFHVGPAALFERVGGFTAQLPFFGWLAHRKFICVDWDALDISDVDRPVARAFRMVERR